MTNLSMPPGVIIPELAYPDVREAVDWLCLAFGFSERLRIGNHRVQLVFAAGSVIVTKKNSHDSSSADTSHAIMVCVADVDAHYEQAKRLGASIIHPPTNYEYGERQYSVEYPRRHHWIFSQTIANINPEDWGGALVGSN